MHTLFSHTIIRLLGPLLLLVAIGCKEPDPGETPENFDRAPMLENYANNLILPGFEAFTEATESLETAVIAFTQSPDATTLEAARAEWLTVYRLWQRVSIYDFGPAETSFGTLFENIGTWPIDVDKTETFIADGDTSLANFDRDTRGLLGLDYLLFEEEDAATQAARYSDANRRAYLRNVARDVHTKAEAVYSAWDTGYADAFAADLGISAGSSTSLLYNSFVLGFERYKNFKVAVPLGLRAGQTEVEPNRVEALYSGQSLVGLFEQFAVILRLYEGEYFNSSGGIEDGIGFAEYLEDVPGGPELVSQTRAQIETVNSLLGGIPATPDLAERIETDPESLTNFNTELQRLTRFFKSDMSSLLAIAITFDSGDGD